MERRQQSETARLQYHEKGNNNQDKGGNISENKAGSQEKVLPERRDRNASHDKNKSNLDKSRVDNSKTISEKVSYSKGGGYSIDKTGVNKGSAEVASLPSITASMEGGVSAENSISTEVSSHIIEESKCHVEE